MIYICGDCGQPFDDGKPEKTAHHRLYCDECKKRRFNASQKRSHEEGDVSRKADFDFTRAMRTIHKRRTQNQKDIMNIAIKAAEAGLSYGQYVAVNSIK